VQEKNNDSLVSLLRAIRGRRLPLLQAIQHQFHSRRHSELVKDMEQVVSDDGSDGLAAGVALIVAAFFAFLPGIDITPTVRTFAWSIAGASAAFLYANFPPSTIFLGDAGSTSLGFLLGVLALDPPNSPATGLPAPIPARFVFLLFAAALPLFDLVFAVIRRIRAGHSIFLGDRSHIYDLLLGRDWSPRRVALACYAGTVSLAIAGWLSLQAGRMDLIVISILIVGALARAGSWLGALGARIDCHEMHRGNSARSRAKPV
jgi:UDP-N-acetylmuramyl pentapeptide phosphotransferase/UDP-N-acetylglucosamine-1-phosphate transferase